jgi:hypothetical protein
MFYNSFKNRNKMSLSILTITLAGTPFNPPVVHNVTPWEFKALLANNSIQPNSTEVYRVQGELNFSNDPNLTFLPQNLEVLDTLTINGCDNIQSLPEGLKVKNLWLRFSGFTSLPQNLQVKGYLGLIGLPALASLPSNLHVIEDLWLLGLPLLKSLPPNLRVEGEVHIASSISLDFEPIGADNTFVALAQNKLATFHDQQLPANISAIPPESFARFRQAEPLAKALSLVLHKRAFIEPAPSPSPPLSWKEWLVTTGKDAAIHLCFVMLRSYGKDH